VGWETAPQKIVQVLRRVFDTFDAVSDLPVPAIYEELDATYSNAKFIAVYRNPADWVRSVRRHTRSRNLNIYERALYWRYLANAPTTLDDVPDDVLLNLHQLHHERLFKHFNNRLNFVSVDVMDPDIGQKLASFLEIPAQDFPRFDYKMIPKARHSPEYFRELGKGFVEEIAKRDLAIAQLREEYDTVYRFSMARIRNKARGLIGLRRSR
jgi:hypothetical protein